MSNERIEHFCSTISDEMFTAKKKKREMEYVSYGQCTMLIHLCIKIQKIVSTVIGEVWSVHRLHIAYKMYARQELFECMNNSKHQNEKPNR